MPTKERRLNIRVSDDTHYWLNLDAARHGRSLQAHVNALLETRAQETAAEFGNVRPPTQEGTKGGEVRYPTGGTPGWCVAEGH